MNWKGIFVKFFYAEVLTVLLCLFTSIGYASASESAVIDTNGRGMLHLREEAASESESRGLYYSGTEVVCRSDPSDEWVRVSVGADTGYMASTYLKIGDEINSVQSEKPLGMVIGDGIQLRQGPSKNDEAIHTLNRGEMVTVLGETSGHWYWVQSFGKSWNGYVQAEHIEIQENAMLSGKWLHSAGNDEWGTEIELRDSGVFSGCYYDHKMEPKIEYKTMFSGVFSDIKKIDEYTFQLRVSGFQVEGELGTRFESGKMIISDLPAGMAERDEFILFLPGTPVGKLTEAQKAWPYVSENGVLTEAYLFNQSSSRGFIRK